MVFKFVYVLDEMNKLWVYICIKDENILVIFVYLKMW